MSPITTNNHWKRTFATIYLGQAFSIIGSAAVQFAIIWYLTKTTASALTLTFATLVGLVPGMLFGVFAGVWIDRYNRKTIMILADGLVALSSVFLGIVFLLFESPPVWIIYVVLFVRGLGSTFHGPAMQAAIPALVPADMLTKAGGWGNLINSIGNMLGPVLGAALMGILPIATIMLVDILGAAFAIACLLAIHVPDLPASGETPHFFRDLKQGFQAARQNKPLLAAMPAMLLCNIVFMPLGALFPLLVFSHFGGTEIHNSIVEFVFAGGLLVSSLVIGVWGGMKKRFLMAALFFALLGITSFVSGILPAGLFWVFVVVCFFMGTTGTFINVPLIAYVQETTPPEQMGKVFSLIMTASTWAMPIGLLIAGPVSEVIGVAPWFAYSGIVLVLVAVLFRATTRKYDQLTMRPDAPAAQD